MDPDESVKVIDAAGGDTEFAKLLGIEEDSGYRQRVNNWRRRGIPSDVVLQHYDCIRRLKSRGAAA